MTNLLISLVFSNLPNCFILEASRDMSNWVKQVTLEYHEHKSVQSFEWLFAPTADRTFWRWRACLSSSLTQAGMTEPNTGGMGASRRSSERWLPFRRPQHVTTKYRSYEYKKKEKE
jgi:hypothetical protein